MVIRNGVIKWKKWSSLTILLPLLIEALLTAGVDVSRSDGHVVKKDVQNEDAVMQ